jgi:predicted DNA-binding transcriptional regulator YafY
MAYLVARRLPVSVEELMEGLPAYAQQWARKGGARNPAGIRGTVTEALTEGVSCRIRYLKPGDDTPLNRTVPPYALAHAEGSWYLLAYCEVSEGVRIFRIDRILEAAPTGVPFEVPDDFDGGEYLDGSRVYRGGDETAVRVRYSPRIARWIAEREEGERSPDGAFMVTHRVVEGWEEGGPETGGVGRQS